MDVTIQILANTLIKFSIDIVNLKQKTLYESSKSLDNHVGSYDQLLRSERSASASQKAL